MYKFLNPWVISQGITCDTVFYSARLLMIAKLEKITIYGAAPTGHKLC